MKKIILVIYSIAFLLSIFSINGHATQPLAYEVITELFSPLPAAMPGSEHDTKEQITLGKKLYFDTSLSVNNTQSCNSCHNILNGGAGVDNLKVSVGALGSVGTRNALTTWNAGLHVAQFWDGKVKTLEEQAVFPIVNPKEMAIASEEELTKKLLLKGYLNEFTQAFPDQENPITMNNVAKVLAAFQRTLITKDRFDDFLAGDKSAITEEEKNGLDVFIIKGCVGCHNGPLLGGQLIMKMGLVNPYPNTIDKGRAHVTGKAADNFFFKVPSLRDVMNTAPYFHDGAVSSIEQAIKDTGWHQLGIELTQEDTLAIKAFFNTLNNEIKVTTEDVN